MDWPVGGDAWPPGQLPPAPDRPPPAAARWASGAYLPLVGGLVVSVGDVLVGQ
jgi:hypothetical protein